MKRSVFLVFMCCLLLLCSCNNRQYSFGQKSENIKSIDIIYVSPYKIYSNESYAQFEAIATIDRTAWDDFIQAFREIPSKKQFHDPTWGISGNVIRITYEDDSFDVICAYGSLYYSVDDWENQYYLLDETLYDSFVQSQIGGQGDGSAVP